MVRERNWAGKTLGVCAEARTGFWEMALAICSPTANFPRLLPVLCWHRESLVWCPVPEPGSRRRLRSIPVQWKIIYSPRAAIVLPGAAVPARAASSPSRHHLAWLMVTRWKPGRSRPLLPTPCFPPLASFLPWLCTTQARR